MAISSVQIGNFKGILSSRNLQIKPITIFVGANSSGKSSCIHALAALAQTVKVTNDSRPLVLDDEFAMVHLGRFIEIVHSRSYQDSIELGLGMKDMHYTALKRGKDGRRTIESRTAPMKASYRFKCTKRTQETNLDSASYTIGEHSYAVRRGRDPRSYTIAEGTGASAVKVQTDRESAFFLSQSGLFSYRGKEDHFERFLPMLGAQETVKSELSKCLYLGPFRQGPLRRYASRGAGPTEVGAMGESTITMLANETIQSRTRPHLKQLAKWLKLLGLAESVDVSRIGRSDLFDVSMKLKDGESFPIADLGYGMSQILPVLTQCSFAPKGATLLFEQPEIHLHTIAARALSGVFIETAKSKSAHVVLETHSPELVKEFMVKQRAGEISPDDIIFYRVNRYDGESRITPLEFDEHLDIYDNWESGISIP